MSTQVDFYILAENSTEQAEGFACRLAEKAYRQGEHLLILTTSEKEAKAMDELLWSFRADSFVPHSLDSNEQTPIIISHQENQQQNVKLLINLQNKLPEHNHQYERILEIIAGDESQRQKARARYREYRKLGCKLNAHKLS